MGDVLPLAHGWWLIAGPVHGHSCPGCRRQPGGPDHVPATPPAPPRKARR